MTAAAPVRLPPQDWIDAPETLAVMRALGAERGEARFIGGVVRDTLLGRTIGDIDIATVHQPDHATRLLRAAGLKVVPTGLKHGTVTAVSRHVPYQITTLRHDVETDGRHAVVAYTDDWEADAARRDFTLNAMSLTLDRALFDPFGGQADAEAGRVRFVGAPETRIQEDVLRILRFFRFRAHFGRGPADPPGLDACRRLAHLLPALSGERIRQELLKLLAAPDPAPTLADMQAAGIWPHLLPVAVDIPAAAAVARLDGGSADPVLRLAALVAEAPERAAERLKLSNAERERLLPLVGHRLDLGLGESEARLTIYRSGNDRFRDLVLLAAARAGHDDRGAVARLLALAAAWPAPKFPLRGRDVLALGVGTGEHVGRILAAVETWWIEGGYSAGRAACLDRARQMIAEENGR